MVLALGRVSCPLRPTGHARPWLTAFDPVAFKNTKHILRAAEFLRDLVTREVVSVEHISGVVMLADILTKAASRGVFVDLIKQLDSFA